MATDLPKQFVSARLINAHVLSLTCFAKTTTVIHNAKKLTPCCKFSFFFHVIFAILNLFWLLFYVNFLQICTYTFSNLLFFSSLFYLRLSRRRAEREKRERSEREREKRSARADERAREAER